MGRALLPGMAAALGFGIVLGTVTSLGAVALILAGASLLGALATRKASLLWLAVLFIGMGLPHPQPLPQERENQLPLLKEAVGRVSDLPELTEKRLSFTLQIPSLGVQLLVYGPQEVQVKPGDVVRVSGQFGQPEPEGWAQYLLHRGVSGLFWAERVEVVEEGPPGILAWAARVRARFVEALYQLPEPARGLLSALLLGVRGLLGSEEKEAFRRSGVAHLLALSGLHVGILVAGGLWFLRLLRIPTGLCYLLLLPLVGAYVLLGGLRVSLLRASIMFAILALFWFLWERGWILRRWLDSVQGLSVAALVVLLLWPWSALDAGFQLSFSATAGIILLLPKWQRSQLRGRIPRLLRRPADLLAVTACAQVASLPFLGTTFGYISPYGLLANLILVPWAGVILWAGLLSLPFLFLGAGNFVAPIVLALVNPHLWVVQKIAELPGSSLPVGPGFGLWYMFALLGILMLQAAREDLAAPPLLSGPRQTSSL